MAIKDVAQRACALESQHREMERAFRIAKEMSNLIIYCRSINFNLEKAKQSIIFYEMSSFAETKAEKLMCQQEKNYLSNIININFLEYILKDKELTLQIIIL